MTNISLVITWMVWLGVFLLDILLYEHFVDIKIMALLINKNALICHLFMKAVNVNAIREFNAYP